MQTTTRAHLTAADVQSLLDIDRSTVYRMAADGRLPSIRVGRQWRFPVEELERLYDLEPRHGPDRAAVLDALPRVSALISQFAVNKRSIP